MCQDGKPFAKLFIVVLFAFSTFVIDPDDLLQLSRKLQSIQRRKLFDHHSPVSVMTVVQFFSSC